MKKIVLVSLFIFNFITVSKALDIDEKLTLRFLKVSNTKKTILINRGAEDGLVVGDHAKFFITSGIVARGVVEKVSPTRSIWALYRIVDPEEIIDNKVLNLKIASPVKVTLDPSRSLKEETIPAGNDTIAIPPEETKEKNIGDELNTEDQKELEDLGIKEKKPVSTKAKTVSESKIDNVSEFDMGTKNVKSWEAFGSLSYNSLSGTEEGDTGASSTSVASSVVDLSLGIEHYFSLSSSFKDISLFGLINKKTMENGDSAKTTTDWFLYGGGANYHFYNRPYDLSKLIGFATLSAGLGSVSISEKVTTGASSTETTAEGSSSFYSFGAGVKYYINSSFGARMVLDYFSSSESFSFEDGSTVTRSLGGPRLLLGINYRF